jgi:hypothetical protein
MSSNLHKMKQKSAIHPKVGAAKRHNEMKQVQHANYNVSISATLVTFHPIEIARILSNDSLPKHFRIFWHVDIAYDRDF